MATAETIDVGQQIATKAISLADQARAIRVSDQVTFDQAQQMLTAVVDMKREAVAHHKPVKEAAWKTHQAAVAAEKRVLDPLLAAEGVLRPAISGYLIEQERIRQEEQRRAREEVARIQREQEEAHRRECERIEAEQRAAVEAQQIADALQAEAEGAAPEEVTAILEQPAAPVAAYVAPPPAAYVAPVVPSTVQRAAGISAPRENWSAEVVNLAALVQYVSEQPQYLNLLLPNQVALNQLAKAQKSLLAIPGVVARNNPNISVRRS
jgi:hypothetical protein